MTSESTANSRIFFVADSPRAFSVIKNDLRTYSNIEVILFDSIDVVLSSIDENPPLLILVEGRVGNKTALQLLEAIKSDRAHRNIPVIIHSRMISSDIRRKALRIGVHAVYHNPRDHTQLKNTLTKLIERSRHERGKDNPDIGIRNRLGKITKLTPLPTLVQSVLEISSDPKSSATQLAEVIKKDITLTARILKIVNSAYYGFHRQIGNVNHSIVILGFEEIRNISLAACFMESFSWNDDGLFNWHEFWVHSLGVAFTSRALSKLTKKMNPEDAFVVGLLHDFGKVILEQHFQVDFHKVLKKAHQEKRSLHIVCKELLNIDHTEIGSIVAEQWQLPVPLKNAIEHHHNPTMASDQDYGVYIVNLANYFCHTYDVGSSGNVSPLDPFQKSIDNLGITGVDIDKVWNDLSLDIQHLRTLL